jgi:hypothetical protein
MRHPRRRIAVEHVCRLSSTALHRLCGAEGMLCGRMQPAGVRLTGNEALGTVVMGRQLSGHGALRGSCARFMAGTPHEPLAPHYLTSCHINGRYVAMLEVAVASLLQTRKLIAPQSPSSLSSSGTIIEVYPYQTWDCSTSRWGIPHGERTSPWPHSVFSFL